MRALASGSQPLTYHGGRVLHAESLYALFWEPSGGVFPSGYGDLVGRYLTDVAHDSFGTRNVLSVATQYFDRLGSGARHNTSYSFSYRGSGASSDSLSRNGCANYLLSDGSTTKGCVTDDQILAELESFIAAHGLAADAQHQYLVFTPPGLGSCFDSTERDCYTTDYCAYHSYDVGDGQLEYAVIPYSGIAACSSDAYPNGNDGDAAISLASHEIMEMITDPIVGGWYDSGGNEIGDKCAFVFGPAQGATAFGRFNQTINGDHYWTQTEWSNRADACVQRNTFPHPTVTLSHSPASPSVGQSVQFVAVARDSDDTAFVYRWSFPSGAGVTGAASATKDVRFVTAGLQQVSVIVSDKHGDQARATGQVVVRPSAP